MSNDLIILGRLKKSLLTASKLAEEDDRNVYVLSDSLDELANKYPNTYLKRIEGMKNILSDPDFFAKGKNSLRLFRMYYKNQRFFLMILTIERKERWIFKSLQSHSYPAKESDDVLRIH